MVKARVQTDDGLSIEVETSTLEYEEALASTLRAVRRATTASPAETGRPSSADLRQLVEKLSDETIEYLRLLVEHPKGLNDHEITQRLGLESRQKLAGMNGAVTKTADNLGLEGENIIRRTVGRGQNGRTYHYVIPDAMRPRLANVLPEEPESGPPVRPAIPEPDDVPF